MTHLRHRDVGAFDDANFRRNVSTTRRVIRAAPTGLSEPLPAPRDVGSVSQLGTRSCSLSAFSERRATPGDAGWLAELNVEGSESSVAHQTNVVERYVAEAAAVCDVTEAQTNRIG